MLCPYHDTHDLSGISERCYYCTTTDEEHAYLQKLARLCQVLEVPTKIYRYEGSSNVYISRIRKENSYVSHRAEIIPPRQKHTSNALDHVHQHIRTQKAVPDAYLRYLSTFIQPEDFCTVEELCLFSSRKETR